MRLRKPNTSAVVRVGLLAVAVIAIVAAFSSHDAAYSGTLKSAEQRKPLAGFQLPTIDGQSWTLEAQRGHVVLVNFWATWCPPCRMETPELVALSRRYETQGLRVIGVSMDDDPGSVVPAFVSRYRIPYPILKPEGSFALASAIESLPTTLLVDRQGRIARSFVGAITADDVAGDIQSLLHEKP